MQTHFPKAVTRRPRRNAPLQSTFLGLIGDARSCKLISSSSTHKARSTCSQRRTEGLLRALGWAFQDTRSGAKGDSNPCIERGSQPDEGAVFRDCNVATFGHGPSQIGPYARAQRVPTDVTAPARASMPCACPQNPAKVWMFSLAVDLGSTLLEHAANIEKRSSI